MNHSRIRALAAQNKLNVSALFVETKGIYPQLIGLDRCWDFKRDARLYGLNETAPVVAHPPCNLWVNMAELNYRRYGGTHNKPGNDSGKFESALKNVFRCGGVLEHPARSKAWEHFGILPPVKDADGWALCSTLKPQGGRYVSVRRYWVCRVWQATYGCRAQKETWLLYVGCRVPFDLDWRYTEGTHQVGWFDRVKPTLSKKEASATPEAFAWELLGLADWSTGS